ncbi:D-2-hydroxyacid dehydrogenase [Ruegeria sp. EL01]|uniref:D-2-hydroxyacid dehydrogenase n=1 Tax=Ruegeria sp. EL01 TaxID=2107578 RepID=UPI001C1F56F2|nr:D-2-hydroxyacid dehydrogenase [Ruegeria sp. EL01]
MDLSKDQLDRLQGAVGNAVLVSATDLHRCEVAFGNPPADAVAGANALRWIQLESVGYGEYLDIDWATLGETITLTNLAGFFADPVAETALSGILALYRGIDELVLLQAQTKWVGDPVRTGLRTLRGAHVVLIGGGSINQRLTELLAPFECKILAVRSSTPLEILDQALSSADVVVAAVPDNHQTRGLFDHDRIGRLKPSAMFVNLGRGSLVDEAALAEALRHRRIFGAVLDVTIDEPLSADHPFWTTPNTLLTQHTGGGTTDELDRKIDLFLDNLTRYRSGKPLLNVVDIQREV